MASIDPRYRLTALVKSGKTRYRIDTQGLASYLIPKNPPPITAEMLH